MSTPIPVVKIPYQVSLIPQSDRAFWEYLIIDAHRGAYPNAEFLHLLPGTCMVSISYDGPNAIALHLYRAGTRRIVVKLASGLSGTPRSSQLVVIPHDGSPASIAVANDPEVQTPQAVVDGKFAVSLNIYPISPFTP